MSIVRTDREETARILSYISDEIDDLIKRQERIIEDLQSDLDDALRLISEQNDLISELQEDN